LIWVISSTSDDHGRKDNLRAIAILLHDHVLSEQLVKVCPHLAHAISKEPEAFLRAVLKMNPHREVQALACLALAQLLNHRLETLDSVKYWPELVKQWEGMLGKDEFRELQRQDRTTVAKQAETLFVKAADKYADVESRNGKVGDAAKRALFEIRNLSVGKAAPEIEGEDQYGKIFKLSDYRGKVVLLDFWSQN